MKTWLTGTCLSVLLLQAGCRDQASPVPQMPDPTTVTRLVADATATALTESDLQALEPSDAVAPVVTASIPVSQTMAPRRLDTPADLIARPLSWSPDGASLALLLEVSGSEQWPPRARFHTADALSGTTLWDSGDLEWPIDTTLQVADWLQDGTLVLARRDGMFVRPDGSRISEAWAPVGQPMEVHAAPRGERVLAMGQERAWIVGPASAPIEIADWPNPPSTAGWAWSPEGERIALHKPDGSLFLIDAMDGVANLIAQGSERPDENGNMPSPSWLADGRILMHAAFERRYEDASEWEHRIVDPTTTSTEFLSRLTRVGPSEARYGHLTSVSPDGRYITLRIAGAEESGWLYDVVGMRLQELPRTTVYPAVWSPDSGRMAMWILPSSSASNMRFDNLGVYEVGTELLVDHGPWPYCGQALWSPDSRFLIGPACDGVRLIDAFSGAGAVDIDAGAVTEWEAVVWSPDSRYIAYSVQYPSAGLWNGVEDTPPGITLIDVQDWKDSP